MIDSGAEIDEKTELDFYLKYMFAVEQGYLEERIHYPFDNTQVGRGKKILIFLKDYQGMQMC